LGVGRDVALGRTDVVALGAGRLDCFPPPRKRVGPKMANKRPDRATGAMKKSLRIPPRK
jgi:hypothetical protein